MEPGKAFAIRVLTHFGFEVGEIPEAEQETADLIVTDECDHYHVEVKDKLENPDRIKARLAAFEKGDPHTTTDTHNRSRRISRVFDKARSQLDATASDTNAFQLIWLHVRGEDAGLKMNQAFSTYYGSAYVTDRTEKCSYECLYFDYADCFRASSVEGLVLTDGRVVQLLLNEFATRVSGFRETKFYHEFLDRNAVFDPLVEVAEGRFIACRSPEPRASDEQTLELLRQQTGHSYSRIPMIRYSFSSFLPLAQL